MMRIKIFFILFIFFGTLNEGMGRQPGKGLISDLESLFNRISNTRDDNERLRLNDSVKLLIDNYVASDTVMKSTLGYLRYPGHFTSSDSRVKIITWNLALRDGTNKYFLYLIRKAEKGKSNRVYKLTGQNSADPPDTGKIYNQKDWYGALYYSILPFKSKRDTYYILLGLDFGNPYTSRKIIDVLGFNDNDDIVFGKDCFIKGNEIKAREVIEYSAEGVITLRVESKKEIVFDHIVPYSQGHGTDSDNYGAGLTFDGYVLKKGNWTFVSNIDVKNRK